MAGTPKHDGHGGLKADINVTPLVDVVLVLLIIFIVVTPMLTRGKNVQLPVAAASEGSGEENRDPIVLTVTADKQIWIDSQNVQASQVLSEMRQVLAREKGRDILIKADKSVAVRELRPVLQSVKQAGARRISFAVLGPKGAGP